MIPFTDTIPFYLLSKNERINKGKLEHFDNSPDEIRWLEYHEQSNVWGNCVPLDQLTEEQAEQLYKNHSKEGYSLGVPVIRNFPGWVKNQVNQSLRKKGLELRTHPKPEWSSVSKTQLRKDQKRWNKAKSPSRILIELKS